MLKPFVALLATSLPVAAEAAACSFTTECYESEACNETAFDLEISKAGGALSLVTDAASIPLTEGGSSEVRVYVGVTMTGFHLISLSASGIARYTTHLFAGPQVVSYLGQCKEAA